MIREWVKRVSQGGFEAIPDPFTWRQSAQFAHLIAGYEITGGFEECAAASERVEYNFRSTGEWQGSPLDLWMTLYFQHRACRHSGWDLEDDECIVFDSLCEALRNKLVRLDPAERGRLVALFRPLNEI